MRELLSTYDSRGVEPLVALAVRLRELDAEWLAEEPEWGLRPDVLGIHSLSGMGVR